MKIKRSVIEQMIKEELTNHIREMMEGPKNDDDEDSSVVDAASSKKDTEKDKDSEKANSSSKNAKPVAKSGATSAAEKLPVGDEPEADKDLEKDVAGEKDAEEDAEEVTGGKIADAVTGQTIQSLTMEPKSKILPGAQEIEITFKQKPDPLKILITKTGIVKFFYAGGLHNEL